MSRSRLFPVLALFLLANLSSRSAPATHTYSVHQSVDGGATWREFPHPFKSIRVNALHANGDRVWAGTENGLFASRDGGKTWRDLAQSRLGNIQSIAATADVMVLGTKSGIWRAEKGSDWSQSAELKSRIIRAVATDGTSFYAGLDSGGVLASADKGVTWQKLPEGLPAQCQIFELKTNAAGELFAGLYSKGFYAFRNGAWQNMGAPFAFTILPLADDTNIVGGNPGGVLRTDDGGKTWSNASGLPSRAPTWMLFKHKQTLFVGATGKSALFRSDDLGRNWFPLAEKYFGNKAVVAMAATEHALVIATVNPPTPEWMDVGKIARLSD
ncbi:MAG TPA: hypothetical protein VM680_03475 [Verrucomicrobiae bacterium]|nr:hypothetical protein [Verrucomicrobiae bacterium]